MSRVTSRINIPSYYASALYFISLIFISSHRRVHVVNVKIPLSRIVLWEKIQIGSSEFPSLQNAFET